MCFAFQLSEEKLITCRIYKFGIIEKIPYNIASVCLSNMIIMFYLCVIITACKQKVA